jgi:predicted aspartyl protease
MKPNHALTSRWNGVTKILRVEVGVSMPFAPPPNPVNTAINVEIKKYNGIWDTGATHSVITKRVVAELDLKPVGIVEVHTANGQTHQKQYIANLYLPNQVAFGMLRVTEAPLHQADVLIGMDIISRGDFCVTNFQGKTVLTFRVPSCQEFDFVKDIEFSRWPRSDRRRLERERSKI